MSKITTTLKGLFSPETTAGKISLVVLIILAGALLWRIIIGG